MAGELKMFMKNIIFVMIIFGCYSCFCEEKPDITKFLEQKPFYTMADFPNLKTEVASFSNINEKEIIAEKAIPCSEENWQKLCENMIGKRLVWQGTVQKAANSGNNAIIDIQTLFYRHFNQKEWTENNQSAFGISVEIKLTGDFAELRKGVYDSIPREKKYKEFKGFMKKEMTLVEVNKPGSPIKTGTFMGFVCEVTSAKTTKGEKTIYWNRPNCGKKTVGMGGGNGGLLFISDLTIEITARVVKFAWNNQNPQVQNEFEKLPYPNIQGWIVKENEEVKRLEMVKKAQNK
jgi:hypothetical protein